jgi:hypothetical protein
VNINQTLDQIKAKHGRAVAKAFEAAIAEIRSSVVLRRVIEALEQGNIDAALSALNIDESAFAQLRAAIAQAYSDGGAAVIAATRFNPPNATKAVVRWDVTNAVAERYLREQLGTKITRVTQDTIQSARDAMVSGYSKGQGPRQIALDIVGRVGVNGKRSGGVLGLNGPQQQYVRNMRAYLESGDYNAVLRMSKRDKRFDKTIMKAMRDDRPLSKAQIDKLTQRYSDRLLKLRGDTIARTETANAVEQSRIDGFRVGLDKEGIHPQYVTKEWLHGGGGMRPREQHVHESGQKVQGLDTPFVMQDFTLMQRPHDPAGPAKHVINCTCTVLMSIDWPRMRRDGVV